MSSEPSVTLYGRPGCCLCDEAREILLRVRRERPFAYAEHDIDGDEQLLRAYLERIPVVTIDGEETFELWIDEAQLRARLQAPGAAGPGTDRLE